MAHKLLCRGKYSCRWFLMPKLMPNQVSAYPPSLPHLIIHHRLSLAFQLHSSLSLWQLILQAGWDSCQTQVGKIDPPSSFIIILFSLGFLMLSENLFPRLWSPSLDGEVLLTHIVPQLHRGTKTLAFPVLFSEHSNLRGRKTHPSPRLSGGGVGRTSMLCFLTAGGHTHPHRHAVFRLHFCLFRVVYKVLQKTQGRHEKTTLIGIQFREKVAENPSETVLTLGAKISWTEGE